MVHAYVGTPVGPHRSSPACECQILQRAGDAAVVRCIGDWIAVVHRELRLGVHRRGDGVTMLHTRALKKFGRVLSLVKKEAGGGALHLDAEKKPKRAEILQGNGRVDWRTMRK